MFLFFIVVFLTFAIGLLFAAVACSIDYLIERIQLNGNIFRSDNRNQLRR